MKRPHIYRKDGRWTFEPANAAGHKPNTRRLLIEWDKRAANAVRCANNPHQCRLHSWANWCPCQGWCL